MILLSILTGDQTGIEYEVQHFPLVIGRAPHVDLRLEEPGVFDEHLTIEWQYPKGYVLRPLGQALVSVNSQAANDTLLKNGDVLDIGSVKVRFWLGAMQQRNFLGREVLTWMGLILLLLSEVALIYWIGI